MQNIFSEPVYIIDEEVQTACDIIKITRSMVLQLYPLDECFSYQIGETLYSSKIKVVNGETADYFHDQYTVLKIVVVMLPGFKQVMLQRQINDDWIQIDDQQIYSSNDEQLVIRFSGSGLITQINKRCLASYPFYRISATEEIQEISKIQDIHAQFVILQLLIDIYIPDSQLQQISKVVFQDLFIQTIVKAQDILLNLEYQKILKHIQENYKQLKFKPYFAELLKYALTSNRSFQLNKEQSLFFINILPQYVIQQYTQFQQFKIRIISLLIKDFLKIHYIYDKYIEIKPSLQSIDQLIQIDALENQETIFNNKDLAQNLLQNVCMQKNIPQTQLVLIQQIFLLFPEFRTLYLKLILNFNPGPYIQMFKLAPQQLTIPGLYFLIATFDQFPQQFQQKIATFCLHNIDRINFALESFQPFLEHFQFFKVFLPQSISLAFKECTKDMFLCESYFIQNISYTQTLQLPNPVKSFSCIKENEQQILEQLGYEETLEIKQDQLNEDDSEDEGDDDLCFICMCHLVDPIQFQCSHKICSQCLAKVKWNQCFCCKRKIISFTFKNIQYLL